MYRVKTLDSFNLNNIDYIKIDAEGYEIELVRWLKDYRKMINLLYI